MKTIQRAVVKAMTLQGKDILLDKEALINILEDMIPEPSTNYQFIRMIYDDKIGSLLWNALQVPYIEREGYFQKLDLYLKDVRGIHEQKRTEFIDLFKAAFKSDSIIVKKYKDYRPALCALKKNFGENIDRDIVRSFTEENKLFYRFSITVDDVIRDLEKI